ncbi:VOC family protein [Streptomyces sp. NPDC048171]|uniref:VOC family protein n=1 Tax=Streptomyces sp. NPDC048171 TaxID=3365504 RepID=UPI00372336EC
MADSAIQGIKTVLHPVADVAAAKKLYTVLFGIEPQTDSEYYVGFDVAGQHVGLVPAGAQDAQVAYWHVADIEAKLSEVTAAGATVTSPAKDVGGGRRVATFTDPDGNVVGLLQDS